MSIILEYIKKLNETLQLLYYNFLNCVKKFIKILIFVRYEL
jgi:hypothetical protein